MQRHRQHVKDDNGIEGGVIFTEHTQPFTYLGIDDMDIVINGFKPAEISGYAAAFFMNEILGQKKHCRRPVKRFFTIGKRQVVSAHWPEILGMGTTACWDDKAQQ